MAQSWRYARVTFDPAVAGMVTAKLVGWAAMGGLGPDRGPGLTQSEGVQLAASLAARRHVVATAGRFAKLAIYDPGGVYLGTRLMDAQSPTSAAERYLPIVGDEALPPAVLKSPYSPTLDPTDQWPRHLCLAIDRLLTQIGQSEQAGEIPSGYGFEPIPGAELAAWPIGALLVVVGGAALGVIGTVAVWRYLDPEVRTRAASIDAAAKSYQARLIVAETTGIMPPASPLEVANAQAVKQAADEQQIRNLAYGAAAVVGIGGGAAALAYLRRQKAA